MPNSGTLTIMEYMDGFSDLGAVSLNVIDADRLVIGILEECRDKIALALGSASTGDIYYVVQLPPEKARQLAASLLNKSDSIEGIR